MQFKKFLSVTLSVVAAAGCALVSANPANASKLLSGVALGGGSTKGSSTFLSNDPVNAPAYNYPTYLIDTLKRGKNGCGVNYPARNNGNNILPNVGRFRSFYFYYDVPNLGPAADPNLTVVIQTNDGFSRIATATSTLYNTANNANMYEVQLLPANFSPSFSADQTRLLTASLRYNGVGGPIYVFYPILEGQNATLYNQDFNFKTLPDTQFNNQ